jgi:hypothetical protein
MSSDSYSAIRGWHEDIPAPSRDGDSRAANLEAGSQGDPVGVVISEYPSARVIYLDEDIMHSVSSRLLSDRDQFPRLKHIAKGDSVRLDVLNDASAIDAIYFAQRIWLVPRSEVLIEIPPLDGLYPGAAVRVRGFLRTKKDLLPDRLTLVSEGKFRVRVEMANRGVLSANGSFLDGRGLFVVGQLRRVNPLSLAAGAILLLHGWGSSTACWGW